MGSVSSHSISFTWQRLTQHMLGKALKEVLDCGIANAPSCRITSSLNQGSGNDSAHNMMLYWLGAPLL